MSFFKPQHTNSSTTDSHRSANTPFIGIQAKLNIGKSNDKYEKEADSVADKVVQKAEMFGNEPFIAPSPVVQRSEEAEQDIQKSETADVQRQEIGSETEPIQQKTIGESITPLVQKQESEEIQQMTEDAEQVQEKPLVEKISFLGSGGDDAQAKCDDCAANEKENSLIQRKCPKCEEKEVQQKSKGEVNSESTGTEQKLSSSKGGGNAMSGATLNEMNHSFGTDFSGVRIHTDSSAVQMNKDLGAKAFTNGSDVYFNEGQYSPKSNEGKHLLAHELTHTVQQGAVSNTVQKAADPCARPENTEAQEECPAEEPQSNQISSSQQSSMSEASEEPPEGTEEPENDAAPVENNPQPAENEMPNPEDEVEDTEEIANALENEDPETALEENAEDPELEDSTESTEIQDATEQGGQDAKKNLEGGRQSTEALAEHQATAEINKEGELQNFAVAQDSLSGSTNSIQSISPNVKFSNEREENGEKSKVDANEVQSANQSGSDFISSLIGKTAELSNYSSIIESRVLNSVQVQKDRLTQTVATRKQQIAAQIIQTKAAAQERATLAKTSIETTYQQTILQIELDAMLAIGEMTLAKDDVSARITTETETQSTVIEGIYTDAKVKIEASGTTVGNEALAIGEARASTYSVGKTADWDSWYEGWLTNRRIDARVKSARDVSKSYSDGLVGAANEQAAAAMEGKQGDLDNITTLSQQSSDGLTTLFDQLVGQLESSKKSALTNAENTRDSSINVIDSGLSQLIDSLDEQRRSQFDILDHTLATKTASLDIVGYQSMSSQFIFLSDAIQQMQEKIEQFRDMLSGREIPNQEDMAALFAQISGSMDAGIASMIEQFNQSLSDVEIGVLENGNTTEASINTMKDQAISTVLKIDESNKQTVDEVSAGALSALTTIGKSFTASSSLLVISSVTQFDDIATRMQELLTSASESIALRFDQSASSLESALRCSLRNLNEDITCYANEAASHEAPAWKSIVKWILIILIVVLVTVFLGPAVIGLAGGLLGSAFAGAVVGGAIVGALAGGAIQVLSNWETNRDLGEGVGTAMALGALGGAIGGGISAALGGTSLSFVSRFAIETIADGLVEVGIGVYSGTFNLENFGWSMLINVGMNLFTSGLSVNSRVGGTQQRIMHGSGNVGARITGRTNPFPAVPAAAVAPRPNTGDVDVDIRAPEMNTRTETDAGNNAGVRPNEADVTVPRNQSTDDGGIRTETDAPRTETEANAPKTETEEPRSSHRDSPEVEEGTGIVAQFRTPDGHTVKVLQDGRIIICSTCGELKLQYAKELIDVMPGSNPPKTFGQRLTEIEAMPNPQNKSAAASQLRTELESVRATNGTSTTRTGNELASDAGLPNAPEGYTWVKQNGGVHLRKLSGTSGARPTAQDIAYLFSRFGQDAGVALPRLEAEFPGSAFSELVGHMRTGRIDGDFDQFRRINGPEPDATAAIGELDGFVRAINRGNDTVEGLVPPTGPGSQGIKTPEAEVTNNGRSVGLEIKIAPDPSVPPQRNTWRGTFDKAYKQIKSHVSGMGEIQFDFSRSRLDPNGGLGNRLEIESFMKGKMNNSRGRQATYFEIIWRDPSTGQLMVSSITRNPLDGLVGPVSSLPL